MKMGKNKVLNEIPKYALLVIDQVKKYEPLLKETHRNILKYPVFRIHYGRQKGRLQIDCNTHYNYRYFETREELFNYITGNGEKYRLGRRYV